MKVIIYTDGGSRGNPGEAAVGVVILSERGETIKAYGQCIGVATNNQAEYQAVIFALEKIKLLFSKREAARLKIDFRLDSELVVKQLNHQYKIKESEIQKTFLKLWNLMPDFGEITFTHILRGQNKQADRLVNEALDGAKNENSLF